MTEQVAYIALGSNIGDRGTTLLKALKMIDAIPGVTVRMISQFLQTDPVGGPEDQPKYINAVAEVGVTLAPQELLKALQEIERSLGRRREDEPRWGPRTCDLDILLMGQVVLQGEELTIPHPRMHERAFVLRPLANIAPGALHPVLGKTAAELLAAAEASGGQAQETPTPGPAAPSSPAKPATRAPAAPSPAPTAPSPTPTAPSPTPAAPAPTPAAPAPAAGAPRCVVRRKAPREARPRPGAQATLISVIGLPASGKTTLAELLVGDLPAKLLREDYEGNPFLADSYIGPPEARLPAQLFYLLSRVRQLSAGAWPRTGLFVSDYGFCQDRLYAAERLSEDELAAYDAVYGHLAFLVHPPDLLIHLDAAPDVLLERIARRGRRFEKVMTEPFLSSMRRKYNGVVASAGCPVLTVRCDEADLRVDAERACLVEEIRRSL